MSDFFKNLYFQFLNGDINKKNFEELRDSLNRLSDAGLSENMKAYWLEHDDYPVMEARRKQYIRRKLSEQINPRRKKYRLWTRVAASAAVIALLTVTAWNISVLNNRDTSDSFLAEVPSGNKVLLTLPDKSSVKLNSESSLSYTYDNGTRRVKLTGEAYFNVAKDKEHPFVVQVGDLNIEVLGTSFNVCCYDDSDLIETSLIEGSVRLYDSRYPSRTFTLKPNQKALYSGDSKIRLLNTDNVKETAWIYNNLVFESEKLSTVLHRIERWYGVKIQLLCPEIANDRITGSFKNEQLPYVMEALRIQYGFTYEITGSEVVINKSNKLNK